MNAIANVRNSFPPTMGSLATYTLMIAAAAKMVAMTKTTRVGGVSLIICPFLLIG
jgi:p-aminobenzoyl-glutamate transporter AbgT